MFGPGNLERLDPFDPGECHLEPPQAVAFVDRSATGAAVFRRLTGQELLELFFEKLTPKTRDNQSMSGMLVVAGNASRRLCLICNNLQ